MNIPVLKTNGLTKETVSIMKRTLNWQAAGVLKDELGLANETLMIVSNPGVIRVYTEEKERVDHIIEYVSQIMPHERTSHTPQDQDGPECWWLWFKNQKKDK